MNERFKRAAAVARIDLAREPDFTLGRMEVRPSLRETVCDGRRETIDRRVMQVLVALARADGGVVSRDDLIESCWDGVVVGEDAINNCISRLRKVAEANGNAFAIETVPRVGYRLRVPESALPALENRVEIVPKPDLAVSPTVLPQPASREPLRSNRMQRIAAVSVVTVLLLAAAGSALWRFWSSKPVQAAAPVEASVAVLPFVNMSGDPKKEYFSDGFSEELVNDLTNEPHLRVASRTSSFAFKGRSENIGTIASALNVHAVVEGSVRESGDRVRITAQLINAADGYHLWSADYTRNLTDILSLQDELARAIAAQLTNRLVPAPVTPRPKIDPAVYRLYLEGLHQFDLGPPQGWRTALTIFEQVTKKAPDFAGGFAALSGIGLDLATLLDAAPASDFLIASNAAQRALALDPNNTRARGVRALIELAMWDWRASASDLRGLRSRNPTSHDLSIGLWQYYDQLGFPDEALVALQDANRFGPQSPSDRLLTVWALTDAGRYQEAADVARVVLTRQPRNAMVQSFVCTDYALTGQTANARRILAQLHSVQTDSRIADDCQMGIALATGDRLEVLRLLQGWELDFPDKESHAAHIAYTFVLLGDFDKASDWYERAYERRETGFFLYLFSSRAFGYDRAIEKYRATPGYRALAEKPLFKAWQAEHDRVAATLAAHKDPLQ